MYIEKITIKNFKCYEGDFSLDLNPKLNILVSDNEAGKSTILEAIHLALSGWFRDKPVAISLTQSLFNSSSVNGYLASLKTAKKDPPPEILIELFWYLKMMHKLRCLKAIRILPARRLAG